MKIIAITPNNKFDAVAPVVIEGLNDLGHEVIASDHGNSVRNVYSDEEIIEHSKDADYIFVIWGKVRGNNPPKYYLLEKMNRPDITAYIDGSEWTCTGRPDTDRMGPHPWIPGKKINIQMLESLFDSRRCKGEPWINEDMFGYCRWYFKRECYREDADMGIIPFNIGCLNKYFGDFNHPVDKDIDVFCSFGHLNTGLRFQTTEICKELRDEGYNVVFSSNMNYQDYLETIARSKIAISAWGAGNSCMRLWEIMANKTCCFRQKTEILFPDEPIDGEHCVVYSSEEEFEKKIREYLKRPDECVRIGVNGYKHTLSHHTGKARVEKMLKLMSQGS